VFYVLTLIIGRGEKYPSIRVVDRPWAARGGAGDGARAERRGERPRPRRARPGAREQEMPRE
jgi:hypothetical protein